MEKQELYDIVKEVLVDFMEHYNVGEVGRMATVCSLIKQHIPDLVFVGYYLMNSDGKLEIGPYQGAILACGLIEVGKGVCGTVVSTRKTEIVPDVREYPNYIPCDEETLSEIVVPVFKGEEVYGVLDIDSEKVGHFDEVDNVNLTEIAHMIFK